MAVSSTPSGDWANPAVIGLLGFGLTTMVTGLLNTGNLGVTANPVLGLALVFGGAAQLIAGFVALRKGEIFAGSAFVSYGSFWMSLFAMLTVLPAMFHVAPSPNDMLAFWGVWTLVTITYVINAPKHGLGVTATFVLLTVAFLLLDLNAWMASGGTTNLDFNKAMGWEIFLTGFVAWLTATAALTNANYGRRLLPL
jgi:succinate-acetate transporter protein